ncbi:hypothetical protein M758_2G035200 [Ceratodon purpureus]|nr:hypothetical protein M758_2G035200 [Ceratodon purpureus]
MTSNCCAFSCFSSCTRKCKRPSKEDLELSGPMNASSNSRYVTACTTLGEYATTSALPSSDPAPSGSSMERNESVEESIERSKSHWSEVVKSDPSITDDELVKDNRAVFRELQSHPIWGGFFRTFGYTLETPVAGMPGYIHVSSGKLIVGEKFAEGGQAELFHARVIWYKSKIIKYFLKRGYEWVMKVFKKGTSLRQLQSQWPLGYLQFRGELGSNSIDPKLVRYYCEVFFGILLEDGRFAFLMKREHKDLRKLIDQRMLEIGQGEGPFSKEDGELIMYKIACGMNWLHERNIIHRDLKASNVLCRVYGNAYQV